MPMANDHVLETGRLLMRTPTQDEFVECWSETIIRNGLPEVLVDDPLFRKAFVTTSHMDQQPCVWTRELLLERGTLLCHIVMCCVMYCHSKVFVVQGTRLYNLLWYLVDTCGQFHCS